MKFVIGLIVSFLIGAACRYFELPAPAPPMLQGAMLVVAMTLGFVLTDMSLTGGPPAVAPAALSAPAAPAASQRPSQTASGT